MSKQSKQPNVLFLFSDQHKASVLGCEGHVDVITPNLDNLAANGVRFSRAYCQDAICVPSRSSIFSGLYPRTIGCLDNGTPSPVMGSATSMQKTFQDSGYATAAFGKRHLPKDCDDGWDIKASHQYGESPDDNYVTWVEAQGYGEEYSNDWAAEFGKAPAGAKVQKEIPFEIMSARDSDLPDDKTMEAYTAMRTIDFIKENTKSDKPFFCFASFYRPHQPYTPLKSYSKLYKKDAWGKGTKFGDYIKMPTTLREDESQLPPMLQSQFRGENRVWRQDLARQDEQLYRNYVAAYYALVTEIDYHVGEIVKELRKLGLSEDTIIVYSADHGDFVGSHGMVEKCALGHNVYEDTLRVPLIISWPLKILKNITHNDLVQSLDIYPTLLDLCGIDTPVQPTPLQGTVLTDTLMQGKSTDQEYCISENWSQTTVITSRYKYGRWTEQSPWEVSDMLFDLQADPGEINNLNDKAEYQSIKTKLAKTLNNWESTTSKEGMDWQLENKAKK